MESKIKMTEQETELSVSNGINDSKVTIQPKGTIVSAKTIGMKGGKCMEYKFIKPFNKKENSFVNHILNECANEGFTLGEISIISELLNIKVRKIQRELIESSTIHHLLD